MVYHAVTASDCKQQENGRRVVPTFSELGVPFPLFAADVRHASGYAGRATCVLCRQPRVHCFGANALVLPCPQCDRDMAFDIEPDKQMTCPRCGATQQLPALPRDDSRRLLVCYACLRAGRAALDKDTVVGPVTWEPAQAGHTQEMPFEPKAETHLDHVAYPPILLADGSLWMRPSEPRGPLYAAPAARCGFAHLVVAHKPFEPGGRDFDWEAVRVPHVHLMELLRTPTYSTWQGEHWLFCCQQPMVYLGEWSPQNFEQYAGAGKGRALFDVVVPDAVDWLWGHGGAGIYVFRCAVCGRLDSHWDFD